MEGKEKSDKRSGSRPREKAPLQPIKEADEFEEGMDTDFDEKVRVSPQSTIDKKALGQALTDSYSRQKPLGGPIRSHGDPRPEWHASAKWAGSHGRGIIKSSSDNVWIAYPLIHIVSPGPRIGVGHGNR